MFYTIPLLILASANFSLGLVIFLRNAKNTVNIYLGAFSFFVTIWTISIAMFFLARNQVQTVFWIQGIYISGTLIAMMLFQLAYALPNGRVMSFWRFWFFMSPPLLFIGIMFFEPFFLIKELVDVSWGTDVILSPIGYGLFTYLFCTYFYGAIIIVYRKYRHASGHHKMQLLYILMSITVAGIGAPIFDLILPWFRIYSLIWVGPFFTFFIVAIISFAIIKHRFLDIRLIIVRALTYTLLTFFIAFGYMALLFNLAFFLGGVAPTLSTLLGFVQPTFLALIFVFSFQPLRHLFEKYTSNIFYKNRYDAQDVLWKLSRTMASTLALRELSHGILQELLSSVKISYGSIALVRNQSIIWVDSVGNTHNKIFKGKDIFTIIHESYKPKSRDEQIIIFEELSERKKDLKNIMREHEITIVLPLVVRKQLIGGLILGEKHSGEVYSSDDIDLLKIVAPEVAIAVRNALSFEEIKHFNITLEEEVRHATAGLKKANERLKELDLLKDEFVSIASHELRTPMTAIKSYLWMALNQSDQKINQPLKKYLDISYNSTERLIRLVNDMLTVSRIERNKIEINKEPVDITEIVQLVFDELKISADEKHITFTFTKEEKKKYITKGDKEKLREVFQNLIGNALKFTPEKGSITLNISNKGKMTAFSVTDTGSGIPKEEQGKLFKKFSKIEYSYSKHSSQPGTGLGLYISKQIISLHNGTIEVQSEVDKGSTFTVLLPEPIS